MPDRILQNQPGVLTSYWETNGESYGPGTVTVTITADSDGSAVVTDASTTTTGNQATYTLTPDQTANLDLFTCVWTSEANSAQVTTYAEIVGGFLFSVAQARLQSPLQDYNTYSDDAIMYFRTLAESALEDACGVNFVPRYRRDRASIATFGLLSVPRNNVTDVIQITTNYNGEDQPIPTLEGLQLVSTNQIFMPVLWNWWSLPIKIAYISGYPYPPLRAAQAALLLARRWLIESPWDERMIGFRSREGGELQILTANHSNAFDIPEVVAVADQYGVPLIG